MATVSPTVRIVRFGVFEVDLASGELRRQGMKIRLAEQPFRVFALLLERHGMLVTREDLRAKLWPADTFVDFDHGLNTAISKIRRAVGDSASNPRFIETVNRRGYRFLAPVEFLAGKTLHDSPARAFFDWEEFWQGFFGETPKSK